MVGDKNQDPVSLPEKSFWYRRSKINARTDLKVFSSSPVLLVFLTLFHKFCSQLQDAYWMKKVWRSYGLTQPHFVYECSSWYPNLTNKFRHRVQTIQIKCMCFCLKLEKLKYISHEQFGRLNWLPVTYRSKQCVVIQLFLCISMSNAVAAESNFQFSKMSIS